MLGWSELADRVAGATRTSEKTSLLARYLALLPAPELRAAATFLAGRPFAEVDQRSIGLGWATIAAVVSHLAGAPAGALGEAYDRSSDLGQAVADVLALRLEAPDPGLSPTLEEVAEAFAVIEIAPGPAAKGAIFAALLERCDTLTAKYVVKILTGELRIGLREGLLEAAIAEAFDYPQPVVSMALMLTGDTGETAVLAKEERLHEARLRLLHPIKFMLASSAEDAAAIISRLGPTVWVEDKYDGIRAQLHRRGSDVRLYSRDLHDVSDQFPEIVEAARPLDWDGILDGEILAYADGHVLPFLTLQARLGRKGPTAAVQAEVPVVYVAFDLLAIGPRSREGVESSNGRHAPAENGNAAAAISPLLGAPLTERRQRLEALGLPAAEEGCRFALSHLVTASSVEELDRVFAEARARRNEGLMVKDPNCGYSPGRRGLGWLKMKRALATLDCVVVGVEVGHGKRHAVLSDYTFAVRDEASDRLVTIGKAYTGLTDAEIAEMTAWFEAHTVRHLGRYRQVEPLVVVEVAFDVIQRSSRHQSGFALRFPRIVALRTDKGPNEIDTLANVERLHRELQHGAEYLVTTAVRQSEKRPLETA
ncbi:MAG TPA: ATP-dependent DNA ligase [Terriglobales bacterium]|nr:ATP-dependent DNA ligase [Terriglobales bacterium]